MCLNTTHDFPGNVKVVFELRYTWKISKLTFQDAHGQRTFYPLKGTR